ncbi:MAG: RNA polymerase subunit sigma-54 [Aquificaceae bacterium]|nr:RNA polymerase subunit sigma-54 [Aquificaceae bacterium]
MKDVRVTTAPRTSLLLKIENSLELLTKTSEELLQELENKQQEKAQVKLTLRTRPRWFYQDYQEPQAIYRQSEIRGVEEQLRYEFDGEDLDIALEIVASLDHRGFFRGSLKDIAMHYQVDEEYVEDIREFIKREIEPLGVACKNLEEFLLLQLEELYPDSKALHEEVLMVLRGKSRDLRARELLSRLKLSPFEGEATAPQGGSVDVVFEFDGSDWYVFLMDDFWDVEAVGGGRSLSFVLELRRRLLRTVGELIIERQAGFILGKEPLKSLTLGEVAERSGVNLSTVSRVVSRKYARTPVGVYPLRAFFLRESKGGMSREEILKVLKELLEGEGRNKSDAELSRLLSKRGINIARRTVNKYRRMLQR